MSITEIIGKHNTAEIMTSDFDAATEGQVKGLCDLDYLKESKIRIMPDCHAGAGCVIGTTMTLTDKVIPNIVGVDIGCGMITVELDVKKVDFVKLDKVIREFVPAGFDVHKKPLSIADSLDFGELKAYRSLKRYEDRARNSVGTLGGGNHFIEIDYSELSDKYYLVVHTGSRQLGLAVAEHYQTAGYKALSQAYDVKEITRKTVADLTAQGRTKEISKAIKAIKATAPVLNVSKEMAYVSGELFDDYIADMRWTQNYARTNRQQIADTILKHMRWNSVSSFHTVHNYIDVDNMILRKGAVSAQRGEQLLIPLNMRDGSLLCVGKGNSDWNYSAPHGAGRKLSRTAAKEKLGVSEYKEQMQGVFSTCINKETLDESPMAYKDSTTILESIETTVEVTDKLKSIFNFKAYEG